MRRYLTLVFLLCLGIPAGVSISGCVRNPAGNYCNGLGYGPKDYRRLFDRSRAKNHWYFDCIWTDPPDRGADGQDLQRRVRKRFRL